MQKIPLILTRPVEANGCFRRQISDELGKRLDFVASPLMRVEPVKTEGGLDATAAAIFTSSNGVRFAPPALGRTAYCVGRRTTTSAISKGWNAHCLGQTSSELIARLIARNPQMPLVHLSGMHVRGEVVQKLRSEGIDAHRIVLYDQIPLPLTAKALDTLASKRPAIVPLFSPRTAKHFAAISPENPQLRIATLSVAVADPVRNIKSFELVTAAEPTAEALIECVERLVHSISLG